MAQKDPVPVFKRIVVGVDGQQGGQDALALAGLLAAGGGELMAVDVHHGELTVRGSHGDRVVLPEDLMTKLEGQITAAGVNARPIVVHDPFAPRALHAVAEREHADLIVVGSSHLAGAERILAGDDALGTLYGSPCPVAIAPRGYTGATHALRVIGVGFDDSTEARAALTTACELARSAGASVRILTVVPPPVPTWPVTAWDMQWPDYEAAVQRARLERVERLRDELDAADAAVIAFGQTEVAMGKPSKALRASSSALDLLVLGSRRHGPLRRSVLGSTSDDVVRDAACPVLVAPRGVLAQASSAASAPGARTTP